MAQYENWLKTDLDKLPQIANLGGYTFTGDALSVKVGVIVTKSGVAETLTGDVTGYVIRPDGVTVVITGDKSTNKAWVELPESAFSVSGMCSLAIRITYGADDSNKIVLGAATFNVKNTSTTTVIDPDSVVPTYQELVDAIDALEDDVLSIQSDISDLQTALGGTKILRKSCGTTSGNNTITFTFTGICNFVIFTTGGVQALRSTIYGQCTSGGSVAATKVNAASSSDITVGTSTSNKLILTNGNTSSYGLNVLMLVISYPGNVS